LASKTSKYSPELRTEVVKTVLETGRSYAQVARDFGLVPETVRTWVRGEQDKARGNTPEARESRVFEFSGGARLAGSGGWSHSVSGDAGSLGS
jgi:transposase